MDMFCCYGTNEILAATLPDPAAREARMREMAGRWASEFDPNSRDAAPRDGALRRRARASRRSARACSTSSPARTSSSALDRPGRDGQLTKRGVDATYVEIDTDYGHLAANADAAKWAPALTAFLARLAR